MQFYGTKSQCKCVQINLIWEKALKTCDGVEFKGFESASERDEKFSRSYFESSNIEIVAKAISPKREPRINRFMWCRASVKRSTWSHYVGYNQAPYSEPSASSSYSITSRLKTQVQSAMSGVLFAFRDYFIFLRPMWSAHTLAHQRPTPNEQQIIIVSRERYDLQISRGT